MRNEKKIDDWQKRNELMEKLAHSGDNSAYYIILPTDLYFDFWSTDEILTASSPTRWASLGGQRVTSRSIIRRNCNVPLGYRQVRYGEKIPKNVKWMINSEWISEPMIHTRHEFCQTPHAPIITHEKKIHWHDFFLKFMKKTSRYDVYLTDQSW